MPAMSRAQQGPFEGPCGTCDNFNRCHGACRGAVFAHNGNLTGSYPICMYQLVKSSRP
jgi:radical SAM protein with 4Fe4S-binding SPASM domain